MRPLINNAWVLHGFDRSTGLEQGLDEDYLVATELGAADVTELSDLQVRQLCIVQHSTP